MSLEYPLEPDGDPETLGTGPYVEPRRQPLGGGLGANVSGISDGPAGSPSYTGTE